LANRIGELEQIISMKLLLPKFEIIFWWAQQLLMAPWQKSKVEVQ